MRSTIAVSIVGPQQKCRIVRKLGIVISFVVPAHNEEQLLPETLRALRAARASLAQDYEIIVVDDASSDGTVELAHLTERKEVTLPHFEIPETPGFTAWLEAKLHNPCLYDEPLVSNVRGESRDELQYAAQNQLLAPLAEEGGSE